MDSLEQAEDVGKNLSFPVAWGVERELGELLGSFWESRRDHIQPTEFLVNGKGRVLGSVYSSSPIGRMDPEETLTLLKVISANRKN